MRPILAVLAGKTARFLIRKFRPGGGSALPGTIAATIDPKLLERAVASAAMGLVVVSGSAGKSTTTKLLVQLLEAHGLKVFTNPSTANIKQGLYAAVLQFGDYQGRIKADIVVLEWDEGHGAAMVERLHPKLAILTNVLSDQLDRFIDPEVVAEKLKAIHDGSQRVVLNADDKNLCQFADPTKTLGFGLAKDLLPGPNYALNFGPHPEIAKRTLVLEISDLARISVGETELVAKASNAEQALNVAGALTALAEILRPDYKIVQSVLDQPLKVFARDELADIRGREVRLMLVQNPTSFQLNLNALTGNEGPLMLMAGSDIHDPSWLWQVDFSKIRKVDIVGGRNAHELALVLKYQGVPYDRIFTEAQDSSEAFLELEGRNPTILFSADAMRRTRRYLGLAK